MMARNSDFQTHGLLASPWQRPDSPLVYFHRHNEIELNFLERGCMSLTFAGRSVEVPKGKLLVFWAGFSHRIPRWEHGRILAISIPLPAFLSWPLPQEFIHRLLHGELFFEPDDSRTPYDLDLMQRWTHDLKAGATTHVKEVVLLEVHARLRRLSLKVAHAAEVLEAAEQPERLTRMLRFIAEHYQEEITIKDVAQAAGCAASYAMELFRRSCGMSIMNYVNDQRVTHARRMLATTKAKVLTVAMDSGFGSLSQFHNVFHRVCGQTPRQYARANRV